MLKAYQQQNGGLKSAIVGEGEPLPEGAVWLDLFDPTLEERRKVDAALGAEMPTRADMEEIEISSRLYQEAGGLFMTIIMLAGMESDQPTAGAITFALVHDRLVTIRYIDPQPFRTFALRCGRSAVWAPKADLVLLQILDSIIDRMADVLERAGADVEAISHEIFEPAEKRHPHGRDFQSILRRLGRKHDLSGKIRESLLTVGRMLTFLNQAFSDRAHKDAKTHTKTLSRDVQSLQDHTDYLTAKLSYLQDATLGLINNDQNNIIKIMSVAAMVFLPPTLFASIWGMNFRYMPEMDEHWAYPASLVVMVISAVVPYLWFKRRGWL
jgi:magnesium transporter